MAVRVQIMLYGEILVKKHSQQLDKWRSGQVLIYKFLINKIELNKHLLSRKYKIEMLFDKEVIKDLKVKLNLTNKKQAELIANQRNYF